MSNVIRNMICYFNGGKPSAENLFDHYVNGVNGIYDYGEATEIAEEGCISIDEARIVQDLLSDGYIDSSEANRFSKLGYSNDFIKAIAGKFSAIDLNDGLCKRSDYHRAVWIVKNMANNDYMFSTQRGLVDELSGIAGDIVPCVYNGKVDDWFTDRVFEMFDVKDPGVRDAAARAVAAFWQASSGVDGAEIVDDIVDSAYLVEIIENAVDKLGQGPAIHLFESAIAQAKEDEFDEQQMISLYKWVGDALARVEKIGPSWIGFIGKHIDDTKEGTAARLSFERAIREHKTEILDRTRNDLEEFEPAAIRVCEESGLEALPSLANIMRNSFQLEVRQLAERALVKMGLYPSGPHTDYVSNGLLLSILKKPAALMAFIDAIDILEVNPTGYCGIISSSCDGSERMNDVLALCNGVFKKYHKNHCSIEK